MPIATNRPCIICGMVRPGNFLHEEDGYPRCTVHEPPYDPANLIMSSGQALLEAEVILRRGRQLFIVIDDVPVVAERGMLLNHVEWVVRDGLFNHPGYGDDPLRGFIDPRGLFFFRADLSSIDPLEDARRHLPKIVKLVGAPDDFLVHVGLKRDEATGLYGPASTHGTVKENLPVRNPWRL